MNDNDFKIKTSKGKILIPLIIVLLTGYVGKQQIFQNYIVGINGWGLGFFFLFFYTLFEMFERVSGDKNGKFRTFKYFCGFIIFVSFLMVVFDWETKNLDLVLWLLLFSFFGIISYAIINTDTNELAGLDGLNLQIKETEAELKEVRRQIESANKQSFKSEKDIAAAERHFAEWQSGQKSKQSISQRAAPKRAPKPKKSPFVDYGEGDKYHNAINDDRWYDGESGKGARFSYFDYDGVVTEREIRNWHSDGPYIRGFCLLRKANRTFKKDQIFDWEEVD